MEPHDRILTWISGLQASTIPTSVPCNNVVNPRKGRRSSLAKQDTVGRRLLSPPNSVESCQRKHYMATANTEDGDIAHIPGSPVDGTSPNPKRARVDHHLEDMDADPTPRVLRTVATSHVQDSRDNTQLSSYDADSLTSASLASSAQSDTALSFRSSPSKSKKRSRRSSPRKQSMLMVMEDAIRPTSFGGPVDPPEALDAIVTGIDKLASGAAIISHTAKESVQEEARANRRVFRWVEDRSFTDSLSSSTSDRHSLGPTPSVSEVKRIWSNADDCYEFQHFESQWNCAVHHQILFAAFGHSSSLGFCSVTGVQIHPNYARGSKVSHHNKKVDFCVFVNRESPRLTAAALLSPFQSVNHTDYPPLLRRPIAISIETKTPGDKWTEAVNQMSAWLIAQWDALDDMVARAQALDGDVAAFNAPPSPSPGAARPSPAAATGLAFLPGVIVQGHEWYFIAITRAAADGYTRRWEKVLIGSTQSTEGVYKIVAVLQLLGRWVEDQYWPWFQRNVLGQNDSHVPG
ncbi:uncharacterized protein CTRU02_215173 [Colletotrichum truncatum]|uniref:Uncharacterized protein n=1 Tax=Colletotrichum truncatum TaxID=5467 RepID=A0ACC3YDN3_COLTU|nr:uncharacterized protein CTRU02_14229 [Colletotrichum truncatum]KAF6782452.1 hypothetical protein CTRU02_14229 [Colletotrichum truncatum]